MTRIEEARKALITTMENCPMRPDIEGFLQDSLDALTPAPIPGLDPEVQARLIDFYMGGPEVEGWAWDNFVTCPTKCFLVGISPEWEYRFLVREMGDNNPAFFAHFSLTDPREGETEWQK